jgi:lysyl-tRNA synthetase class 2
MRRYCQQAIHEHLRLRADILQAIRTFFRDRQYLEVETPVRIPAPAPEAHIDAQESGRWFLHTSPELCMKMLLSAGFPRIFQICRCFRKNERGRRHLPEFSLLEWYTAGHDYLEMMAQCEALLPYLSAAIGKTNTIVRKGREISLSPPWEKLTVAAAFDQYSRISMQEALRQSRFDEIMGLDIEPHLGMERPVFLYDYPASCGALARLKPEDVTVAERFELYIAGIELCNAFTELTDPVEQRCRFEQERLYRQQTGKTVYPLPENFLEALTDMPAASGNAMGIDRIVMLLTEAEAIDDIVAFTPEELG